MASKWPNNSMSATFVWCKWMIEMKLYSVAGSRSVVRLRLPFYWLFAFLPRVGFFVASHHISLNVIKILILILLLKCIYSDKATKCASFCSWRKSEISCIEFVLIKSISNCYEWFWPRWLLMFVFCEWTFEKNENCVEKIAKKQNNMND